jgi:hypothetical protein
VRISHTKIEASDIFHEIKFYAVEIAATIVFVVWLAKAVWHELGL